MVALKGGRIEFGTSLTAKTSAGLVVYRRHQVGDVEVLLVHPGGPYWAKKDAGAWSIPKGEYGKGDDPATVADIEFGEEIGQPVPLGTRHDLGEVTQPGGKRVRAWAVEGDVDTTTVTSNEFEMQWPPRSGQMQRFPEVDRAAWFGLDEARVKILSGQIPLLERLQEMVLSTS